MIHEVDHVLKGLLRGGVFSGTDVEVSFEAPSRDWAARRNTPTIDAYLYDIREDTERRQRGAVSVKDAQGIVLKRRQPPRWFRLSYLVTAWTKRPEDEHRLLSAVMATLLPHEVLTPSELTGALAELGLSVPITIGVPPAESRSLADIWSALGGELKPSLDVVVTAPFPAVPEYAAGPPVTEGAGVRVRGLDGTLDGSPERHHRTRHLRQLAGGAGTGAGVSGPGSGGGPGSPSGDRGAAGAEDRRKGGARPR
ncbi:DUF4255 domain-containing protein [Streptomyces sp. S07_1.15]|uniref:DUF4255 domain-containing protein n=1 Tax=Streptomyces sp. S07_1.15 TaxID=2873925 RepID=UPI001D13CB04|nr:DUF4255 domain-containing protein [Streptomyces sp. S07_1.15]MCC3653960.1 DUF4255 domain-containing protein [Streptomyces sp. S07_1.15]